MTDNPFTARPQIQDEQNANNNNTFDSRLITNSIAETNDVHKFRRNSNSLIIGCSGSGKTTGFVYDAIRQKSGSIVVSDTKNNLSKIFTPELRNAGYNVMTIDFVDLDKSDGYNPLDYIRRYDDGKYHEQDVQKLAQLLSPVINVNDTYWEATAQTLLTALIALVMEIFDPCLRNLNTVGTLAQWLGFLAVDEEGKLADNGMKKLREMFTRAYDNDNNSYACKCFSRFDEIQRADRTWSCIISYVQKAVALYDITAFEKMFSNEHKIDFAKIGKERTALFVNVSDTDRSLDSIVTIFYSQLFQQLILEADKSPDSRLAVPVHIIMDDFATNCRIADVDKLISVIRSRNICMSLLLQSITQLNHLYGSDAARTIINNADTCIYLGGNDLETANYVSQRSNKPLDKILEMGLDKQIIMRRGEKAIYTDRPANGNMESGYSDTTIPKISKGTTKSDNIVIAGVAKSLLHYDKASKPPMYRFGFAYKIEGDSIIYANIKIPVAYVRYSGSKYDIDLGIPDTQYNCELSDGGSVVLTALVVSEIFETNKRKYLASKKANELKKSVLATQ